MADLDGRRWIELGSRLYRAAGEMHSTAARCDGPDTQLAYGAAP